MNPLKERTEARKTITTLFIGSALLIGFMGMSLSFTQTAMAQPESNPSENRPTPQCPEGSTFERGECTTIECPPESFEREDGSCFEIVEEEIPKDFPTCPNSPFTHLLADGRCHPNTNPMSASQPPVLVCPPETDVERDGKCFVEVEVDVDPIEESTRPGQGNNP